MSERIKLDEITYKEKFYPRSECNTSIVNDYLEALSGGAEFPAIVLCKSYTCTEKDDKNGTTKEHTYTNLLLDGYHRWKAHKKFNEQNPTAPIETISVVFDEVPDGVPIKLYAGHLSTKHGLRWAPGDKKVVAREIYEEMPGFPIATLAKYAGISRPTATDYVKDILARFKASKEANILRLSALGWTQQEISDQLQQLYPEAKGLKQQSIAEFLPEMSNLTKPVKKDLADGFSVEDIAKDRRLPQILVWSLKLKDLDDQVKMNALKIPIQPYDCWHFNGCHELFGAKHPGRIPGELVAHTLYFYTKPGDLVLDPMAGSGTTPDVCLAMGRKCYAYDADLRHERPDILKHDLSTGWPERTKKADLIFWDPPYYSKMDDQNIDGGYNEDSVSKLTPEQYLTFMSDRFKELRSSIKDGARFAFLMSDWDDPDLTLGKGIFIWDYLNALNSAGWRPLKHIQVPLPTQQVHPDIVNKFRERKRLARLERYLIILGS